LIVYGNEGHRSDRDHRGARRLGRCELVPRTHGADPEDHSLAPLTVVGGGFAARERVALTVRRAAKRVASRRVSATPRGSFRARFTPLLAADVCRGSLVIVASGAAGSRASVSRPCRPPHPPTH
jgi:hypothetical protein